MHYSCRSCRYDLQSCDKKEVPGVYTLLSAISLAFLGLTSNKS